MSGKMRKRKPGSPQGNIAQLKMLKSFHAPQKDSSKRQRRKARLNNYDEQKESK